MSTVERSPWTGHRRPTVAPLGPCQQRCDSRSWRRSPILGADARPDADADAARRSASSSARSSRRWGCSSRTTSASRCADATEGAIIPDIELCGIVGFVGREISGTLLIAATREPLESSNLVGARPRGWMARAQQPAVRPHQEPPAAPGPGADRRAARGDRRRSPGRVHRAQPVPADRAAQPRRRARLRLGRLPGQQHRAAVRAARRRGQARIPNEGEVLLF